VQDRVRAMRSGQDLARTEWPGYARRRLLFAGRDLLVCEWLCHGEARPWFPEATDHDELDLPRRGMHLRARGRQRHVIDPVTAGFSGAGDEYQRASPTSRPGTSTLIVMRGELASGLIPRDAARSPPITADAATLHFRLLRAPDPVAVEEIVLALVDRVLGPGPATEPADALSSSWRRLSQEIQHVIATRFADRLTLEAIAAICKTSPFHASRVFRAVTGDTIHRRLTRVRLRVALFELHRGAGLARVALSSGFSSHSHFTSSFRREFGVVPSSLIARRRRR
jgi:AraC family transcriptional regulator